MDKRYHAVVQGLPDPSRGTIDAPIDRHPKHDYKFAVVDGGRPSVTHYEVIEAFRNASLVDVKLETGDGKVLLVDVNLGPQDVHSFFRGKPAYSLSAALQPAGLGAMDSAAENLYLATVAPPNAGPAQLGLKKFFDLMPNLKASDFDYIIFDMPPLGQTSPTLGMATFLDKLLVMVQAGKDNRDAVKRGYKALIAGRANVSVLLNKVRSYAPRWVDGEL